MQKARGGEVGWAGLGGVGGGGGVGGVVFSKEPLGWSVFLFFKGTLKEGQIGFWGFRMGRVTSLSELLNESLTWANNPPSQSGFPFTREIKERA